MNSKRKLTNSDIANLVLAIFMLTVFWPVGLFLIIRWAKNMSEKQARYKKAEGSAASSKTASPASKKKEKASPRTMPGETSGLVLSIVGGVLAGSFAIALLATMADMFSYGWYSYYLSDLFVLSGFFAGGLACLGMGLSRRRRAKRFRRYFSYIGKNKSISLAALASAMGVSEKTVYRDLDVMLTEGVLPMGYVDLGAGRLFLTDEGLTDFVPESEPEQEPVPGDDYAILQEIRAVNDSIPDHVMSAKIDRIGEITGKILDYQRSHPGKSRELRSFLNYYLPTTLKVLRAYAQLDAQGIEGENITAAKQRIESMMDQVVYGFEKQLDRLFRDDALDITTDVQVLESMLRQDGLSGGDAAFSSSSRAAQTMADRACDELEKLVDDLEGKPLQSP